MAISDMQYEVDRLAHRRDLLRIELCGVVCGIGSSGWAEPKAKELTEQYWSLQRQWLALVEQIRRLRMEQRECH